MQRQRVPEHVNAVPQGVEVNDHLVPVLVDVGRDQAQDDAKNQGQRVFLQQVDDPH